MLCIARLSVVAQSLRAQALRDGVVLCNGRCALKPDCPRSSEAVGGAQVVGVHFESIERPDFRLCTRCYQHEISSELLTPGGHPMQRITKDAHTQVGDAPCLLVHREPEGAKTLTSRMFSHEGTQPKDLPDRIRKCVLCTRYSSFIAGSLL